METHHGFSRKERIDWVRRATKHNILGSLGFNLSERRNTRGLLYAESLCRVNNDHLVLGIVSGRTALLVWGTNRIGFEGIQEKAADATLWFCPLTHGNTVKLRGKVAFAAPSTLNGSAMSFGMGDRLGIATPGHLRAVQDYEIVPVLSQQSPRELDLCERSYEDVIDSATWGVFQEGYRKPWGADGDHLKTVQWVKDALSAGSTFITADLSDHLRTGYASSPSSLVQKEYAGLSSDYRQRLESDHVNSTLLLDTAERIVLSQEQVMRCALIYGAALEHAAGLFKAAQKSGKPFDFEISIDETDTPTTAEAHIFVAKELEHLQVPVSSLAPRFIGEFQKGIDYRGHADSLATSVSLHSAIARSFGHRLSFHSGSDKFSIYPMIGRQTRYRFHLKTAGTSWLQALRVVSRHDAHLFRSLYGYALEVFPAARRYYHVSPEMKNIPRINTLNDAELDQVLDNADCRQVMHIAYGEILRNTDMKHQLYESLDNNMEAYWSSLEEHFQKHLDMLGVPKRS